MKTILSIVLICLISTVHATDYYFSSALGNDNRSAAQAQNPATPWKTIAKLNAFFPNLKQGDRVLFNRGETFVGAIKAASSGTSSQPITLTAYGNGEKPVISGFTTLSGWTFVGNGIWETTNNNLDTRVNMLTINGEDYAMGRYPNANAANNGYLTYESSVGNTMIKDNELSSFPNWTGAEAVIRTQRSCLDRARITAHNGNSIYYATSAGWNAQAGYGYFIQNDVRTLDQFGEWYYNGAQKKMQVYFGLSLPLTFDIKATTIPTLLDIDYHRNIVVDNLSFQGSNTRTINIHYAPNVVIRNCDIVYNGTDGIIAGDAASLVFDNNYIANTHDRAINLEYGNQNSIIRNNHIDRTGVFHGMADPAKGWHTAVTLYNSTNVLVEHNSIENTGYVAISFNESDIVIRNNYINNFLFVKDDGGAIYTSNHYDLVNTGRKVLNNIIVNGAGAPHGTDDMHNTGAQGIYLDLHSDGIEIAGNTIANCTQSGFYNNAAINANMHDNTFFNNKAQMAMTGYGGSTVRGLNVKNNILFAKSSDQLSALYNSQAPDLDQMGDFDNNYYCRPIAEDFVISTLTSPNEWQHKPNTLADWKSLWNLDHNSKGSPMQITPYTVTGLNGANKFANEGFNSNVSGVDVISATNNTQMNWNSGGKLDGGALEVKYNWVSGGSSLTRVDLPVGNTNASKQYILRFSTQSSVESAFDFWILQNHAPYDKITELRSFKVPAGRKEHEYLISFPATDGNVKLEFRTELQSAFWMDNIKFYEATVASTNPDDHIRFEYNATESAKTVALNGTYVDVKNNTYNNSVTLQPYASVVLIKKLQTASQTISFGALANKTFGDLPFTVSASASSNLPVSFRIVSGPATLSGNTITLTGTGTVVVEATQQGDATYPAAPAVTQSFIVTTAAPAPTVCSATGTILREQWDNVNGTSISDIPVGATPNSSTQLTSFEAQRDMGNNYGARIRGYVCAPQTGNYTFMISGDDEVALYLSTNDNAANKVKIAGLVGWTMPRDYHHSSSQTSAPIYLEAGKRYYIEALHKEGWGGDHVSVAWKLPNGTTQEIPGSYLSPYVPVVVPPSTVCSATGTILREQWDNVNGTSISDIPVGATPNSSTQLTSFEAQRDMGNNYGARIRGYVCAPQTGNYTFMISGDDEVALYLSTNDNAANKVKIAGLVGWTMPRDYHHSSSQTSAPIYLEAGKRYYIEALHKEGWGGDHVSVAWRMPSGVTQDPIAGSYLSPYVPQSAGSTARSANTSEQGTDTETTIATAITNTTSVASVSAMEVNSTISTESKLSVYPNPVQSAATVQFNSIEAGEATVEVYDMQGRRVQRLFSGRVEANVTKTFALNAQGLSNGTYLLRLTTKTKVITQKVIVAK